MLRWRRSCIMRSSFGSLVLLPAAWLPLPTPWLVANISDSWTCMASRSLRQTALNSFLSITATSAFSSSSTVRFSLARLKIWLPRVWTARAAGVASRLRADCRPSRSLRVNLVASAASSASSMTAPGADLRPPPVVLGMAPLLLLRPLQRLVVATRPSAGLHATPAVSLGWRTLLAKSFTKPSISCTRMPAPIDPTSVPSCASTAAHLLASSLLLRVATMPWGSTARFAKEARCRQVRSGAKVQTSVWLRLRRRLRMQGVAGS
mmetsp:Transcript_88322/g.189691  ORF Transcript_88322/g.189691 Transcript_88322/m.189691 type:complete len:263 (-) Transcript_88322:1898-2686(-)